MTQYEISLLDRSPRVILLACGESPPKIISPDDVYIIPDPSFDVCIVAGATLCRDLWVLSLLLCYFYSAVLGYPECTLEVAAPTPLELEIFDTPPGVAAIRPPKCKGLFTNTVTLPDQTTHTLYTAFADHTVRVLTATSLERVRPDALTAFLLLDGLPDAREVVALSDGRLVLPTGAHLSASVIVAAAAASGGYPVTLRHGDCFLTVDEADDALILSTRADLLSKKII